MILVEITINSVLRRISNEWIALNYMWNGYVASIRSINIQLTREWGGYAQPIFTDISFSPDLFESDWPPPTSCEIVIKTTSTDEDDAVTIFDGIAHLGEYDRTSITYDLYKPEFDAVVPASTAFNDTLEACLTTLCGATYLDLSTDYTKGRAVSPNVKYTTTSDILAIDLAAEFCAFFAHGFKIVGDTLYLYDLKLRETGDSLTEFDITPSGYEGGKAVSIVKCGNYTADGNSPYGAEINVGTAYHDTQANIETALADIVTVLEYKKSHIRTMITSGVPGIFDDVTLFDESLKGDITANMRITGIIYNFDDSKMELFGIGTIT